MGFELSIPTRNAALNAAATLHSGHCIRVYSGAVPASPSDSIGAAVLLGTFTKDDDGVTGLTMAAAAVNGVLQKNAAEVWLSTLVATGTAAFYRMSALADAGGASTTEPRIQGTVGIVNADLLLSNVDFVLGNEKRIDSYAWGQPESA